MQAVAKADSSQNYRNALNNLTSSCIWKNNHKFQKYFTNFWLSEKEVKRSFNKTIQCLRYQGPLFVKLYGFAINDQIIFNLLAMAVAVPSRQAARTYTNK